MSAYTADSKFAFQLPSLSYIDAKWEEPSLRTPVAPARVVRKGGVAAWLSRQVGAFIAWRRDSQAASELASMSDRELMDIGLTRTDAARVFEPKFNADLRDRGTYA